MSFTAEDSRTTIQPAMPSREENGNSSSAEKYASPAQKLRQKATNWSVQETSIFLDAWKSLYESLETASYKGKNTIWNMIYEQYRAGCITGSIAVDRSVHQLKKRIQNLTYQYKQFRGPTAVSVDGETRSRINKVFPYFDFLDAVITADATADPRPITTKLTTQLTRDAGGLDNIIKSEPANFAVFAYDDPADTIHNKPQQQQRVVGRLQSALNTCVSRSPPLPKSPPPLPEYDSESDDDDSGDGSDQEPTQHHRNHEFNNHCDMDASSHEEDESGSLVVVEIPTPNHSENKRARPQSRATKQRPLPKKMKLSQDVKDVNPDGFSMSILEEMWQRKLDQDSQQFERLIELQRETLHMQAQQTNAIISGLTSILNALVKK